MRDDIPELTTRIYNGDTQAFKELYDYCCAPLLQVAMAIVRHREMAEEIVADVFIAVWRHKKDLLRVGNMKWYLYATTRNISLNYLRKYAHKKTRYLDEDCLPEYQISPEAQFISNEMMQHVNAAINALPPQCRLIFKLVKEDGLKYREVADLLNISIKTVENQVGIALKKLARIKAFLLASPPAIGDQ
ncbi:RNA polymerase sigma-70 factor, ECF subfamily [Chitinophaga eiseniae]|uniref:RNA polymerase sigma-70 factor, ECF subfamily n=1 Tax=Chitinophaga eiseniae TaxID=634771 RepID=A0A1T4NAD4_9BACT|nr:RNA polymerase sigma-70 factor [Chitinophaga eiseniae]SJZ76055.1 RNA polymerase sigma-70 factor, ECF subfamily [Chitinophaga eiseniae]